ncbi:mitochondrial transcription rescue factor 1 isoform X2 [Trichechus manatus latirostris]|uniref:Mitochondrial transcription rescue factor 1 isoform X2 n=1 Tax=Trichechus manatus latirostris TaxID=127582 RepID=A0A2Y9QPQ2_TRIMA|nr:mitochondrial transcription rescue factor 1 isoform X2 [Trichechus manatus latirostris]
MYIASIRCTWISQMLQYQKQSLIVCILYASKVEDAFYKGELRLNGEKLWKKSRTVKVGDTLDLLIGEDKEAETDTVMRILLKKVFEEKTESEKYRVVLRRWKKLELPKKMIRKPKK